MDYKKKESFENEEPYVSYIDKYGNENKLYDYNLINEFLHP